MKLAVNYSPLLAQMVRAGTVQIDLFKCPAWESVITSAQELLPAYVHFPLVVGKGKGTAWNSDRSVLADWAEIDHWLAHTATPYLNLHLETTTADYPHIPRESERADHIEFLIERALADIAPVVARYGKERVIIENLFDDRMTYLRPTCTPNFIRTVIEESGCGMLLDVSHARLAAEHLNIPYEDYFDALPLSAVRELHLTGIQTATPGWLRDLHRMGIPADRVAKYEGQRVDHVPMSEEDWAFWDWVMEQTRGGKWGQPWAVGYEVGGVGALWEAIACRAEFETQLPRLYNSILRYAEP